MRITPVAALTGWTRRQARWRIDKLGNQGVIKCRRLHDDFGERICRRRAVRILLHVRELEDRYGLSATQAINLVDVRWRRKALKPPRRPM